LTFKDWPAEKTDYPNELSDMALAHTIGSVVEAVYRPGNMFEMRRSLMTDWAGFLAGWGWATVGINSLMVVVRRGKQIEKSKSIEFEQQKYNFGHYPSDARLLLSSIRTRKIAWSLRVQGWGIGRRLQKGLQNQEECKEKLHGKQGGTLGCWSEL